MVVPQEAALQAPWSGNEGPGPCSSINNTVLTTGAFHVGLPWWP